MTMADAKLEIKVGAVTFTGEGAENWLAQQLDKVLDRLPELLEVRTPDNGVSDGSETSDHNSTKKGGKKVPLAKFLKEKNATGNQVRKFLATAVWLHDNENKEMLTSADIVKALEDTKQKKLSNASQSLNNNASKGDINKKGKSFFVTDEGRERLG